MRRMHGRTSDDSKPGGKRRRMTSNSGMRCFIGHSSVTFPADHVHGTERRNDVGELVALEQTVHAAHVHEAWRAHVHLVGHSAPGTHEIEAELAIRRFL